MADCIDRETVINFLLNIEREAFKCGVEGADIIVEIREYIENLPAVEKSEYGEERVEVE